MDHIKYYYIIYPCWTKHILNKTYTINAPWSDGIESFIIRCRYLVYRECLLSCPCVLVVRLFIGFACFHCGQRVCLSVFSLQAILRHCCCCCGCCRWAKLSFAFWCCCCCRYFFAFISCYIHDHIDSRHTRIILYFCIYFTLLSCILNIFYIDSVMI